MRYWGFDEWFLCCCVVVGLAFMTAILYHVNEREQKDKRNFDALCVSAGGNPVMIGGTRYCVPKTLGIGDK